MAQHVSPIVFKSLIDSYHAICLRRGAPPEDLCRNLPFNISEIQKISYRDWSEWVIFLDNLDRAIAGLCSLEELQIEWSMHTPSLGPFRNILSLFVSPDQVVKGVWKWSGPRMFKPVIPGYEMKSRDRIRLRLQLGQGLKPCLFYFQFSALAASHIPNLIGLGSAEILEARIKSDSLDLLLKLPPSRSVFAKLNQFLLPKTSHQISDLSEALLSAYVQKGQAQDIFESLFYNAADGVIIEKGGEILFMNHSANKIFDLEQGQRPKFDLIEILSPRHVETSGPLSQGVSPILLRLRCDSHRIKWLLIWKTQASTDQSPDSSVTFVRDISAQSAYIKTCEKLQIYSGSREDSATFRYEILTGMEALLQNHPQEISII